MNKVLLMCMLSFAIAQNGTRRDLGQDDWSDDGSESSQRRESMVIWRLTEDLDLSSEQAEKFFPRFREHREKLDGIGKDERKSLMDIRFKIRDDEEISKSEMEKTIKKVAELRKDRVDLETKFILGMEDILDPNQMVKLSVFKQRLMKEMQGEMRDRKGKDRKKNRKQMKRGGRKRRGF
jgi:Spy/CpxP family protein refolding chaperone